MTIRFDFYTPSEIAETLGQRLRTQRLSLNLTQAALAERSGIGISTVARIESGQGGTLDNIIRLAIALGMVNHFAELFDVAPTSIEDVIAKQNPRLRASNKSGE
ncbi:helix-turn-helix domain-containing protein [Psychrobacter vallis]|uniref:helix-turn-helix domain-containing protein n=1 Tax=Psychrobacter vallis TaxID=248451 RepID=UPI0019195E12|nr:helix-turn-helix transcriptional regulator [Psychrobacter vallis]